ncbi:MAG: SIMPL domain-containing protein [Caldilineaceae bacterium]
MLFRNRLLLAVLALVLAAVTWRALPAQPAQAQATSGITSPTNGSVVNGLVPVLGTAVNGNFQKYQVYFKPSDAVDSDYQLFHEGTEQVTDGELAVWDTTLVAPDVYTLRLRVVQNDGNYTEHYAEEITVDPNYQPAPPPQTNPTPTPSSSLPPTPTPIAPADAGSIGVSRVITGTASRSITMLGRGVATSAPDWAYVRLYVVSAADSGGAVRPVSDVDLQQVVATLQAGGAVLENVRVIPLSRRADGSGLAGEVRFIYRQPANLTSFLTDGLTRLSSNTTVRVVDVAAQYGVADCATLEVQALRAALLAARARAEPMATVLNVRLGPVLSVSENVAAVPVTGSCLDLLDETTFLPLHTDTPTQIEVAVTLAVTFIMEPADATPSTTAPTPMPDTQGGAAPTATAPTTHTVQPGETVEAIAQIHSVTVEALLAANNLSQIDAQAIPAGTVLNIPSQ